jgi:hypothetical protein
VPSGLSEKKSEIPVIRLAKKILPSFVGVAFGPPFANSGAIGVVDSGKSLHAPARSRANARSGAVRSSGGSGNRSRPHAATDRWPPDRRATAPASGRTPRRPVGETRRACGLQVVGADLDGPGRGARLCSRSSAPDDRVVVAPVHEGVTASVSSRSKTQVPRTPWRTNVRSSSAYRRSLLPERTSCRPLSLATSSSTRHHRSAHTWRRSSRARRPVRPVPDTRTTWT